MDKEKKTGVICISITLFILFGVPLIFWYIVFCPHTYYGIFVDKTAVCGEYGIDPDSDFRIIKYYDGSLFTAIDTELEIAVDDAEKFIGEKVNCSEMTLQSDGIYKYNGRREIYVTPDGKKYRLRFVHSE